MAAYLTTRWLVSSYDALHAARDPRPKWGWTRHEVDAEIKDRLGVDALHSDARLRPDAPTTDIGRRERHDGSEWTCTAVQKYSSVPRSHPDFERTGGVKVLVMVREP